jgi:transposase InsO family protein
MLKREGREVGKKRVYRLYRLEGPQLRMKVKRRKRIALLRGRVTPTTGPNQHWSMDFVHDQMHDGRKFRILAVIDQWSRESLSLEANFRLTGRCVGQALDQAARQRGWPRAITMDNGTEFTFKALDEWAYRRGVKLDDNEGCPSLSGRLAYNLGSSCQHPDSPWLALNPLSIAPVAPGLKRGSRPRRRRSCSVLLRCRGARCRSLSWPVPRRLRPR